MIAMAAPVLLKRARAAYSGELMLMKGPEVASYYREPSDRPFRDLDLLADDAPAAQRALIKAGFAEFGTPAAYDSAQHLCPLIWPSLPLVIEVHRRPSNPAWLPQVSADQVLQHVTDSATGVDGLLAPTAAAHALLIVAHAWSHQPLGRLLDVLDVAAVMAAAERRDVEALALEWGWSGVWRITSDASDSIFAGGRRSTALPIWARHLSAARERTVLENQFARLAAPAFAVPVNRAPSAVARALTLTTGRRADESWGEKVRRSRKALTDAFVPKSAHERRLVSQPKEKGVRR